MLEFPHTSRQLKTMIDIYHQVTRDLFQNPGTPRNVSDGRRLRKLRANSFLCWGDQSCTTIQANLPPYLLRRLLALLYSFISYGILVFRMSSHVF